MNDELKSGRLSQREKDYIERYYESHNAKEIAAHLGRRTVSIERYIQKNLGYGFQKRVKDAEYNIQNSIVWQDLEQQFSNTELEHFLYHWGKIVSQFKEDVFPTEQMQIIDTIKFEILMNRNLNEQQQTRRDIMDLERELADAEEAGDRARKANTERQLGILRAAQASMTGAFLEMSKKKDALLKEMKATRNARIKDIESSRQSFVGWMTRINTDSEMRDKLGAYVEKMRLGADAEVTRLSEYHEYEDGTVDQPFLNEDTVL